MSNILPNRVVLGTVAIGVIEEVNDALLLIFASALNYKSELPVFMHCHRPSDDQISAQ